MSNPAPTLTLNSGNLGAPQGVNFDANNNLYVLDPQATAAPGVMPVKVTPGLVKFTVGQLGQLASNSAPVATGVITFLGAPAATAGAAALPPVLFPQQAVFDKNGNLWVTDHNSNTVDVWTAAQLAGVTTNNGTATNLTPVAIITVNVAATATTPAAIFNGPLGIAFDAAGDLFVANNGGVPTPTTANGMSAFGTQIFEFKANAADFVAVVAAVAAGVPATATTPLTPDVVLTDKLGGMTIQAPWALAFDGGGNLFASNANAPNSLVSFPTTSFAASTTTPVVGLTIDPMTLDGNMTLNAPNGICFDGAFDLVAVSSAAPFGLAIYDTPLQPSGILQNVTTFIGPGVTDSAGNPVTGGSTLNAPAGCTFGPMVN